jgi:hypothetical protein
MAGFTVSFHEPMQETCTATGEVSLVLGELGPGPLSPMKQHNHSIQRKSPSTHALAPKSAKSGRRGCSRKRTRHARTPKLRLHAHARARHGAYAHTHTCTAVVGARTEL